MREPYTSLTISISAGIVAGWNLRSEHRRVVAGPARKCDIDTQLPSSNSEAAENACGSAWM